MLPNQTSVRPELERTMVRSPVSRHLLLPWLAFIT